MRRNLKWDLRCVEQILERFRKAGRLKYLQGSTGWREVPLEALALTGSRRLKADYAARTADGKTHLFIEVDDKGAADHNV